MIEPMHNDSKVKLEPTSIASVGQAREFKINVSTYSLLKLITICLTIVLLAIIGGMTTVKYKQVNNICTSSTK